MVVTMAMTIASRGRSTKIAESIGLPPGQRGGERARPHRDAGPDALQSLNDDLLATGEALVNHDAGTIFAPGLDPLDHGLAVLDGKHIDAALIGNQGRLGYYNLFLRRAAFEPDPHQL